ncbi:MAG TPA: immunoglobulin domain-containing protein, partial [Candidatus Dormibacteraeota bacterium]|nr:immunoglobulin domain-containing protein [Candidatus Dormibacteraeota bacterium]
FLRFITRNPARIRKAVLAGFAVAALLAAQSSRGTVVFTEEYPTTYGDGTALGMGDTTGGYSTKWAFGNSTGTGNAICTSAAALSYPGLQAISATASYGIRLPIAGSRDTAAGISTLSGDGNDAYLSFLLNVTAATPVDRSLIGFRNSTGGGTLAVAVGINSSRQITLLKNGTVQATSPTTLTQNQTYFVVLRYKFLTGSANDQCALWLNPATGSPDESGAGVTPLTTSTGSDQNSLLSVRIPSVSDASGPIYMDEIRIGDAWTDVTPSSVPVVGTKLGFTAQPTDTTVGATMGTVIVQVQGASGGAVASNNVPITLSLTGAGVLGGTVAQNTDSSGKATFSNLSISAAGTGDYLSAGASGIGSGLAGAVSSTFNVTGGSGPGSGVVITRATKTPLGFAVTGTNTVAGAFCQILGTPDVTLDPANWLLVNFGNFDVNGAIAFTNPTSVALPNAFYRLRTGNTDTKIQAPGLTPIADQTVPVNSPISFSTVAAGPMLQYLWLFNGNPIAGATTSSFSIAHAQVGNAGQYTVVVANPAGSASSSANLRVGNYPPSIISAPQNVTVTVGNDAVFSVVADGTAPLTYLWKDPGNSNIPGGTNAVLNLHNVQISQSGTYSVTVANNFGSTNRSAVLTVTTVPTALPDTNMIGFAQLAGVTGGSFGGNSTAVYATNYLSFSNFVRHTEALIIKVTNTITGPGPGVDQYCYVYGNNKTIVGEGPDGQINGIDLRVNATNIIIANLTFQVTPVGTNDAITLDGGSKGTADGVWIDHCTVSNAQDGSIDVTKGADNVTISWCKILYGPKVAGNIHEFVHLIGSSDTDGGPTNLFHVTLHHNWYGTNAMERMPSVRWGRVHVYNCFYTASGNNYCARTRIGSQVLVERNFYQGVQNPWELYTTSGQTGQLLAVSNNVAYLSTAYGNTWVNGWTSGASLIPGTDSLSFFNPVPYDYTPDDVSNVPYYVQTYSGAGKYPYVP